MTLTHFQKKFIKNNVRKLPLEKIADHLKLSPDDVLDYLKDQWRKDKYEKFIQSLKEPEEREEPEENESKDWSHTWERICSRLTNVPEFLIRYSRMENSRLVRWISVFLLHTFREVGSKVTSLAVSFTRHTECGRLKSDLIRARSSTNSNGFIR